MKIALVLPLAGTKFAMPQPTIAYAQSWALKLIWVIGKCSHMETLLTLSLSRVINALTWLFIAY